MQGQLSSSAKKESPKQPRHSLTITPSTTWVDVKVWQDNTTPTRIRWSISKKPTQNSQGAEQEPQKTATEPSLSPVKRRLDFSLEQDDEFMDLPLSQWIPRKKTKSARPISSRMEVRATPAPLSLNLSAPRSEHQASEITPRQYRLSHLPQKPPPSRKVKVEKELLDAIRTNQVCLTRLELQIVNILWRKRPQPGKNIRAIESQQRGGWVKCEAIMNKLSSIEVVQVDRTINGLIERGILESTEIRRTLGAGKLRPLAQRLLEQLELSSLKKIHALDPDSHPRKYGPRLKAVYSACIRDCVLGNKTPRSSVSKNPSMVKKKYVQKLLLSNKEPRRQMEAWERVANAVVDEAGSCVRIVKKVVKGIAELHAWLQNEDA